jgi:hypothetical protein
MATSLVQNTEQHNDEKWTSHSNLVHTKHDEVPHDFMKVHGDHTYLYQPQALLKHTYLYQHLAQLNHTYLYQHQAQLNPTGHLVMLQLHGSPLLHTQEDGEWLVLIY